MAELPDKKAPREEAPKVVHASTPKKDVVLDEAALDSLLGAALKEENRDGTPVAPPSDEGSVLLSQADIDAPLTDVNLDKPLVSHDLDSVLAADAGIRTEQARAATQEVQPEAASRGGPSPPVMLSQDMVDALAAEADEERARLTTSPMPEDAAAKQKRAPGPLEIEETLAEPVATPRVRPAEMVSAISEEPEPVVQSQRTRPYGRLTRDVVARVLKTFASLSAGIVVSFLTFSYLYTHPEREAEFPVAVVPPAVTTPPSPLRAPFSSPGETTVESQAPGEHPETPKVGTPPGPPAPPEVGDGNYAEIASAYRQVRNQPNASGIQKLHAQINDFANAFPSHSKAVEVLQWKAALYRMEQEPYSAREVYRRILSSYADFPGFDAALAGAAEVANEVGQPREAVRFAQQLLADYPESKHVSDAQKALADAYLSTGSVSEAEDIFERIVDSEPGTVAQGGALVGLGRIAVAKGKYDDAIKRLRARISMNGPSQGIDEAVLLLAKAYHGAGQLSEAREGLNALMSSFPESRFLPAAFVELSRVLDDMGSRANALQVAQHAAEFYPSNPEVLRNKGFMLALTGQYREAAEALIMAMDLGLNDPQALLDAARYYRSGEALRESRKVYERLTTLFPRTPQAFVGTVELAELLYQDGMRREGIQRLEQLATSAKAGPQRLPVLVSLAKMYHSLGLQERAAELAKEIATGSTEPEVLAQAIAVLFDSGARDEGIALAKRIDVSKLSEKSAYTLLEKQGVSLIAVDPKKAVSALERAYTNYPKERAPDAELSLIKAYLAADDVTQAKGLMSRLVEGAGLGSADAPSLRQAAVALGDYLYDKKDFPGAAEAYGQALTGDDGKSSEGFWAKYQRANALLETGDLTTSVSLYSAVAKTSSPWSKDAAMKADYARAELRLRGKAVAAQPASGTGPRAGAATP